MRAKPWPLLGLALVVAACDTGWLGDPEAPPLPGERLPVILSDEALRPDPTLADTAVIVPAAVRNTSWSQRGGNAQHNLNHVVLDPGLERAWNQDLGAGNSRTSHIPSPPVIDDGRLFAADADASVQAFDLTTGRRLWRRRFDVGSDRELGAGLAAGGGGVFVATARGEVAALDAASGEPVWLTDVQAPVRAAPTLAGRFVIVLTADNQTYGLDAVNGTVLWVHQGFAEATALLGGPSPAATGGLVVVPYSSGEVYGLVLETGAPIWLDAVQRPRRTTALGNITDIQGSPVIDQANRVFVAGHGGEIAALDAATGRRSWDQRLAASEMPWVAGDQIYVVSTDAAVVNLDAASGRIRWTTQLPRFREENDPETERAYYAGPVLASDRLLLVSSLGTLWSLDPATGAVLNETEVPDGVTLPPVVGAGHLALIDDGGTVHVYN